MEPEKVKQLQKLIRRAIQLALYFSVISTVVLTVLLVTQDYPSGFGRTRWFVLVLMTSTWVVTLAEYLDRNRPVSLYSQALGVVLLLCGMSVEFYWLSEEKKERRHVVVIPGDLSNSAQRPTNEPIRAVDGPRPLVNQPHESPRGVPLSDAGTLETSAPPTTKNCRDSSICRSLGRCTDSSEHHCVATSDADCAASMVCAHEGKCTAGHLVCVAASDQDCRKSLTFCRSWGRCGLCTKGRNTKTRRLFAHTCIAVSDQDCQESRICQMEDSHPCTCVDGTCVADEFGRDGKRRHVYTDVGPRQPYRLWPFPIDRWLCTYLRRRPLPMSWQDQDRVYPDLVADRLKMLVPGLSNSDWHGPYGSDNQRFPSSDGFEDDNVDTLADIALELCRELRY